MRDLWRSDGGRAGGPQSETPRRRRQRRHGGAAGLTEAAAEAANEAVRVRLRETANANAIDERAVQNTRVIAIRKIAEQQQDDTEQPAGAGNKAKVNKRTITCVCNIL